jgi:hypothetical protein
MLWNGFIDRNQAGKRSKRSWLFDRIVDAAKFNELFSTHMSQQQQAQQVRSRSEEPSATALPMSKALAAAAASSATTAAAFVDRDALLSQLDVAKFRRDGFNILAQGWIPAVDALRDRLVAVLRGEYDTGREPTKPNRHQQQLLVSNEEGAAAASHGNGAGGGGKKSKPGGVVPVYHMINASFGDKSLQQLVLSPAIGEAVCRLTGWRSVKFVQDQVWAKPPGGSALSFHRDSTYFDFVVPPNAADIVVTVWITLDDLSGADAGQLGPLEYCVGSHLWGDAQRGSASQFFDPDN